MNSRAKALFAAVIIIAFLPVAPAFGRTVNTSNTTFTTDARRNPIGTCPSQSFLAPPSTEPRLLILSISWTIKNDEDSGISGYWALDHFTTTLKVWDIGGGNYYALKTYTGVFSTPQGAISPGSAAAAENESAFGTIQGGYVATFTGQFTPGSQPTTGSIGTKDYGGTLSDVLLGYYGNGQVGDTHPYDWTTAYFTNVQSFSENHWGWAYLLNPVFHSAASINQWCNYNSADGGNSGDILTA